MVVQRGMHSVDDNAVGVSFGFLSPLFAPLTVGGANHAYLLSVVVGMVGFVH